MDPSNPLGHHLLIHITEASSPARCFLPIPSLHIGSYKQKDNIKNVIMDYAVWLAAVGS